jgi:hypothetical protein
LAHFLDGQAQKIVRFTGFLLDVALKLVRQVVTVQRRGQKKLALSAKLGKACAAVGKFGLRLSYSFGYLGGEIA